MPDPACPICRRPATAATRPFCSVRCADIDLGRWFAEDYRISVPLPDVQDSEDDSAPG